MFYFKDKMKILPFIRALDDDNLFDYLFLMIED